MFATPHRVRRQSWHLRVGSASAAFAARARFRAEVEDLLPAFDDVFDAWAPGESVVRIPRLELKLRVASLDQLGHALTEALAEALRREAPPRQAPGPPASAASDRRALLLRYLETGALDWHAAHAEAREIAALLRAVLLAELPLAVRHAPAGGASFGQAVRYYLRLLQLLPHERWRDVAECIESGESAAGARSPDAVLPSAPQVSEAIAALLGERSSLGLHAVRRLAAAVLAAVRLPARPALERSRGESPAILTPGVPAAVANLLAARLGPAWREALDAGEAAGQPAPPTAPAPQRPSSLQRQPRFDEAERAAAPQEFALMADNAGLVLLHPFLPRLLEACDLCDPRGRIEPSSLPRAAALLHWLAAGRDEVHEFELGAVKVLLGLRPEDPLPAGADLVGAREREEGAALLAAAIGHWKALKGTSIEGFRVSFLQRRGALREEDPGWRLRLETESFDVLLKQLPWNISTVKLPWMTRPLFTDWPTP